jgi:peroxisomal membrane protein 4
VIYIFARVVLGFAKLSVQPGAHPLSDLIGPEGRKHIENNAWAVFASVSWALVMYLFRWHPETLMSSLRSSMVYMYVTLLISLLSNAMVSSFLTNSALRYADSDHWDSFRNLLVYNK